MIPCIILNTKYWAGEKKKSLTSIASALLQYKCKLPKEMRYVKQCFQHSLLETGRDYDSKFSFAAAACAGAAENCSLETRDLLEPNEDTVSCMQSPWQLLCPDSKWCRDVTGAKQRNRLYLQSDDPRWKGKQIEVKLTLWKKCPRTPNPLSKAERPLFSASGRVVSSSMSLPIKNVAFILSPQHDLKNSRLRWKIKAKTYSSGVDSVPKPLEHGSFACGDLRTRYSITGSAMGDHVLIWV